MSLLNFIPSKTDMEAEWTSKVEAILGPQDTKI